LVAAGDDGGFGVDRGLVVDFAVLAGRLDDTEVAGAALDVGTVVDDPVDRSAGWLGAGLQAARTGTATNSTAKTVSAWRMRMAIACQRCALG
jgi:hypothetical protein